MGSKPIECSVDWCLNRFDTVREMKQHKLNEPDHFYCKRCDVDCKDWEDLTNHKVEAMAPYIEGKKFGAGDQGLKHIVCEFCGEDFKSWGGRRRHRTQAHKADQEVECPGCQMNFARASHFIKHLEFGECPSISLFHFQGCMQQKHMVGQLMKDPEEFERKMEKNRATATSTMSATSATTPGLITDAPGAKDGGTTTTQSTTSFAGQITDGSEALDQEDGGVPLLIDLGTPPVRHAAEAWPRLPSQDHLELADSMSAVSVDGGAKTFDRDFPPLGSTLGSNASLKATVNLPKPNSTAGSWATTEPSQKLFPGAKKEPPSLQMIRMLEERDEEAIKAGNKSNAFHSHFLHLQSPEYRADHFVDKEQGGYYCPFPRCHVTFETAVEVGGHIADNHSRTSFTCPCCHKFFSLATSLIAHAESAEKCRVRESSAFNKLLDEVSGGFLMSHAVRPPRLFRKEKSLVKTGEHKEGIMDTKFYAAASKV